MDYQKLANLLYPEINKDITYYTNLYKPRNLEKFCEVTRIAPSPTGYLHIGHLYSALINKIVAEKTNGVFYFRLEDTDRKRYIKGAGDIAYSMLCNFGIVPNEGYRGDDVLEIGNYGPYVQSQRLEIYHTFAKHLVSLGLAFPCFCGKNENVEEVLERRENQLETTDTIEEKDPCRNFTFEEIEQKIKNGEKFAIRLKSRGDPNKTFEFTDKIKGKRELRENNKDVVLVKSDGIPPYSLAHVVDDTLMGTTLVVRGEEWWSSLSAHLEIFKAFGFKPPKYAHTPVICKIDEQGNKRKLSKRKDPEADARYFLKLGYPVLSLIDYLLNLLNSDYEQWRAKNPTASYKDFNFKLEKIGSNNPMFDFEKLDNISKNVIAYFSADEVYNMALSWAKENDAEFAKVLEKNKNIALQVFSIERGTPRPRKDISKFSEIKNLYGYMFNETKKTAKFSDFNPKFSEKTIKSLIFAYLSEYNHNLNKEDWFAQIKEISSKVGFADNKEYKANPTAFVGNVSDACAIIRVALTGKNQTPDLYTIMQILGENEVKTRLKNFC